MLDAVETALELQKGTLRDEREVLREHGNMSAPSVLFVLKRALQRGLRGPAMLAALGPGFTASFLALEDRRRWTWARAPGSSAFSWCSGSPNSACAMEHAAAARARRRRIRRHALSADGRAARFWLLGLWMFGHDRPVDPLWLAAVCPAAGGPVWVIASLGRRWTTRIIVLPGAAPVTRGPYRLSCAIRTI